MDKITKHSAGGIVLDPKTGKILFTKKLDKKPYKAYIWRTLFNILLLDPEKAIKKFKLGGFTKGKIELGQTVQQSALQEIEEEGGIDPQDIIMTKYLGSFHKEKKYGKKHIDMFLYVLTKEYPKVIPSDKRHIAAFLDITTAADYIQNEDEKRFFLEVRDQIIQTLLAYTNIDLSTKHTQCP